MDENLELSAANLLSEVKAVKAWVELERARIAGDATTAPSPVNESGDRDANFNFV